MMATVLLMEDEVILARNIRTVLERAGHHVSPAGTIAEARHCIAEEKYDLIVAEITLTDGDSIVLLEECGERLSGVPTIIMTGQDSVTNRSRADDIDVTVFLAKPFSLSRLTELVDSLLRSDSSASHPHQANESVVMYSHDTIGLGHMRRNTAIARALIARVPGLSVLLVVGCPQGLVFETEPGIDFIKLPSLAKLGRNRFQTGALRLDSEMTRDIRAGIIERVLTTMKPDVFLVDHEPLGVWNELEPALRALRANGKTRVVLGLRDILDDPHQLRRKWSDNGTASLIRELYDQVFIYGNESFYPSEALYGLGQLTNGKTDYCGVVTSDVTPRQPAQPAQRRKNSRHVLVSGGGGRDAYPILDTSLKAYESLPKRTRLRLTIVAGPLMDADLRHELTMKAKSLQVRFYNSVTDFPSLLASADLFVTMGGYNSVNEALVVGCPMVIVPRVGPSSEQRIRAARIAELGFGEVLYREELTPDNLKKLMLQSIMPPAQERLASMDFNGASTAACFISAQLQKTAIPRSEKSDGVSEYAARA